MNRQRDEHRGLLQSQTERVKDTSKRLRGAMLVAEEMEQVGVGILSELAVQRDKIARSRDRVGFSHLV